MSRTVEHRAFPLTEVRVKRADNQPPKLEGHAAVFNKLSEDLGGFREKVAPGAFSKTLKESDVRALMNHNPDFVLGRNRASTLSLSEDEQGLAISNQPPDTQWARDLMVSVERGDINQMSFGFRTILDSWDIGPQGDAIRTLHEVELFDVSVVTYPAYPQTDVQARSILISAGIDFDALAGALVRAEHKLPLRDEDRDLLKATMDILKRHAEVGTPSPSATHVKSASDLLALQRMQSLAEMSL